MGSEPKHIPSGHAKFVHLRVKSPYSLLEGAVRPKELAGLARQYRMPAVAVTDTGTHPCDITFSEPQHLTLTVASHMPSAVTNTATVSGGSEAITGNDSASDPTKVYQPFTDDVLTVGSSVIRAAHITELRTRINTQRVRFGLTAFTFTDGSLTGIVATTVHVTELRTALQQAYTQASLPAVSFTDTPLVAGTTRIKALHIQELRDALVFLEGS
jgi:hypothetical protein